MPLGPLGQLPFKFFFVLMRDTETKNVIKRAIRGYDKRYFKVYRSFGFLDDEMTELDKNAVHIPPVKVIRPNMIRWLLDPLFVLYRRFRPVRVPVSPISPTLQES